MIPFLAYFGLLGFGLAAGYLVLSWKFRPFPLTAYCAGGAGWSLLSGMACWWGPLAANAGRSLLAALTWFPLLSLGFLVAGGLGAVLLVAAVKGGDFLWRQRRGR